MWRLRMRKISTMVAVGSAATREKSGKWGTMKVLKGCLELKTPYCTPVDVSYL